MIREDDLREAIAECEGSRNPSASTCIKLASYYALLDRKTGQTAQEHVRTDPQYSYASTPIPYGNSELSRIIEKKGISECYPIIEETIEAMEVIVPKLYHAMLRKLDGI